ncbi:uncharacterized protein LOC100114125 isoform X2 [Nasonia vitripennis]|uniref:Uncharacterized protein n=1 Tax=Nasonia vitripennis TaxID=7425 RepID=A0A7M7QMW3_NASVI|nr:uncharacterized protein LOC100114125 isoform X2 [Nasonia vitripennis]
MLQKNPGLLSEKIAYMSPSNIDWKLIQKVNLDSYFETGDRLLKQCKTIQSLYDKTSSVCPHNQLIKSYIGQIQETKMQSEKVIELLVGLDLSKTSIQRRSVLPFVGQTSRFLFGTMDEKAQRNMENLIELSSNDTRKTAKLLAQQTELVETEFQEMNIKINKLTSVVSNISKSFDYYYKRDTLQIATQILDQTVTQYKLDTEIITDAIFFASQGSIHPRFLSPDLIYKSAELVRETVPDAIFPLNVPSQHGENTAYT